MLQFYLIHLVWLLDYLNLMFADIKPNESERETESREIVWRIALHESNNLLETFFLIDIPVTNFVFHISIHIPCCNKSHIKQIKKWISVKYIVYKNSCVMMFCSWILCLQLPSYCRKYQWEIKPSFLNGIVCQLFRPM